MAVQLQEAKSQIQITSSANATMQWKILQQERCIRQQKATIQNLKAIVDNISQENDLLHHTKGTISSHGCCHKQTRTARPGEDVVSEGIILYPSPRVVDEIKKMRDTQFTQKYVDPMGEARLIPIIKLRTNMYTAIHRCLSKHFRIRSIYTQGQGSKIDWIAEPKNQRITRSM